MLHKYDNRTSFYRTCGDRDKSSTYATDKNEGLCRKFSFTIVNACPSQWRACIFSYRYVSPMHRINSVKMSLSFTIVRKRNSCTYEGNRASLVPCWRRIFFFARLHMFSVWTSGSCWSTKLREWLTVA